MLDRLAILSDHDTKMKVVKTNAMITDILAIT